MRDFDVTFFVGRSPPLAGVPQGPPGSNGVCSNGVHGFSLTLSHLKAPKTRLGTLFQDPSSPPRTGLLVKLQDDNPVNKMICIDFHRFPH